MKPPTEPITIDDNERGVTGRVASCHTFRRHSRALRASPLSSTTSPAMALPVVTIDINYEDEKGTCKHIL